MASTIQTIPLLNLAIAFIPVVAVIIILHVWSLEPGTAVYAVFRMLVQLLLVGYLLTYIFGSDSSLLILLILFIMIMVSAWISLRPLKTKTRRLYLDMLLAIIFGGCSSLWLVTQFVLELKPWFLPQYMIPLAGMIFANAMNTVSLAAERYESELTAGKTPDDARRIALHAAMIPTINALLAVGLVSLPGMMTGQILSGVSPLIAVRYQVMVMCMVFGSSGLSAACYLYLRNLSTRPETEN